MTVALQQVGPADGVARLAGTAVAALRGVRLPDGALGDVLLDGTTVALAPGDGADLDAQGWRVLPAACEPHAHLDKALTASRLPPGIGNDLVAACDSWRVLLSTIDRADTEARALARGETHGGAVQQNVAERAVGQPDAAERPDGRAGEAGRAVGGPYLL